ncbi:DUF1980 domain-containing protein [Paenibacillus beijingensis]|uniref:DUF1980 domain-containing protein n=1 Tax=Paenibacillus beijingensis TaxID=1126833 RepID=A0A0D5NL62_9BACL|nr:DUF1980 domain-containing protein [Paenibacillus beijingensis]AJY75732.1 hypothetical protein VN24_15705 [Paenibacillus beijingensis]
MSAARRVTLIHHSLRALTLFLYSAGIALLAHTGRLDSYIEGYNVIWVKLAALTLGAASVYEAFAAVQIRLGHGAPDCGCGHDHIPSRLGPLQLAVYALFLIPPALWLLFP